MSLPIAPRDISEKPRQGAVTDPINKELKDADVDRKMRFYGVIEAFRQGRLPDNQQIDETLAYVRDHSPIDIKSLSSEGQKLVQDVRDIVETARVMVAEKNADELFQNFMWHTRMPDYSKAKQDPNDLTPVDKSKVQSDGQQALAHLRTLLALIFTNGEARKLFSDFTVIGRDLFATAAVKAAEMAHPGEERLDQVDQPAPKNQFVTEGGRRVGPDETPVPEVTIPGTDTRIAHHPKDEPGYGAQIKRGEDGEVLSGAEAAHRAQDKIGTDASNMGELKQQVIDRAKQEAQQRAGDHGGATNDQQSPADASPDAADQVAGQAKQHYADVKANVDAAPQDEKGEAAVNGLKDKFRNVRDSMLDRVPQEHKDRSNEHYERGKNFLNEEYFPPERRDQFIFRMKKVIVECQKHDDYQESIQWLLGFVEEYARHGKGAASQGTDSHAALKEDPALNQALNELRTLVERFANGCSFQTIIDPINQLIDDSQQDESLKDWFRSCNGFIRKVLLEPGFVLSDECNDEANRLRDTGRQFYDDKYSGHFDNLFHSISFFFTSMGDDPINARFGQDWARLTKDLLFDSEGSLKYKPELWSDIRKVIVPQLIDQVGYIPVPRIEYSDDSLDLVLENLTLSGRNLFPNLVRVEARNYLEFSPYQNIASDNQHHEFAFQLCQIQADMRDVAFSFDRKSGFPKMQDSGLADVILGGSGLTVTVNLTTPPKNDTTSVFKVKKVNVEVDSLQFAIRDSKHDTLYNTLQPLATGLVKKQIQKALQGAITTGLEYLDGELVSVRERMNQAKASDETSRAQALQEVFQRKQEEATSAKTNQEGHFKVVAQRDSAVLDQGHPAGWVNRQSELADKAQQGHNWRSAAFSIINEPAGAAATKNDSKGTNQQGGARDPNANLNMSRGAGVQSH